MAATISLSFPFYLQSLPCHCRLNLTTNLHKPHQAPFFTRSSPSYKYALANFHRENPCSFKLLSSSSSHSSTSTTPPSSYLEDSFHTGRFLSNEELENLKFLENFRYFKELKSGILWVRVMRTDEMDITVGLLAESVAESMRLPSSFVPALKYLLKLYLVERRTQMPHMATLIGFYRETTEGGEEEEAQLAGTVEVFFDKRGSHASPPSPTPPKDSPYICNMAVKKSLRRRGIGWHLLKASEELISQKSFSREVYLHCRLIDAAPLNMYKKADYKIVKTDNILVLLMLQRRKQLMCKKLPLLSNPPESDLSYSDMEKST